jgi:hypothetical protein
VERNAVPDGAPDLPDDSRDVRVRGAEQPRDLARPQAAAFLLATAGLDAWDAARQDAMVAWARALEAADAGRWAVQALDDPEPGVPSPLQARAVAEAPCTQAEDRFAERSCAAMDRREQPSLPVVEVHLRSQPVERAMVVPLVARARKLEATAEPPLLAADSPGALRQEPGLPAQAASLPAAEKLPVASQPVSRFAA